MAFALQRKHRIYGRFVGTLPRCQHQNSCLGLPLLLSPEEVAVARKQTNVTVYLDTPVSDIPASEDTIQHYHEQIKQHYHEMTNILDGRKKLEMVRHYHQIKKGLEKRHARLLKRKHAGDTVSEEELAVCDPEKTFTIDDVEVVKPPEDKIVRHLPMATPDAWYRDDERTVEQEEMVEKDEWLILRCRVFEDLWLRGHHVTASSAKMGGDFLIYPGDPIRYHASHIVVVSGPNTPISSTDMASLLRLGSSVKKMVLLASESEDGCVDYTTLAWSGTG